MKYRNGAHSITWREVEGTYNYIDAYTKDGNKLFQHSENGRRLLLCERKRKNALAPTFYLVDERSKFYLSGLFSLGVEMSDKSNLYSGDLFSNVGRTPFILALREGRDFVVMPKN